MKARQSRPILDHPDQSNIMCFSFSWDSFVTNNLLCRPQEYLGFSRPSIPLSQLASLSYTCQLSKCNAGDTMRCIFVSIFRSASSKICKDNFNRAFAFETDHIPKKHENAHRAPLLCLPGFLTLVTFAWLYKCGLNAHQPTTLLCLPSFLTFIESPKFIWKI